MKYPYVLSAIILSLAIFHAAQAQVIMPRGEPETLSQPDAQLAPPPAAQSLTLFYQDKKVLADADTIGSWKGGAAEYPNFTFDTISWRLAPEASLYYSGEKQALAAISVRTTEGTADYNPNRIYQFLKLQTSGWGTPAQEPILQMENNRATKFVPPQDGITPNLYTTTFGVIDALRENATSTNITMSTSSPRMLLSQTNTLGINELIAEGVSTFGGSPSNRRHNIKIGVEKESGVILAPGEEFSFNKFLGPVDGQHGFLPELVIKANGTIPEFGGGLCQVSSTAFRAAMQAGFPITQRRNHAYAVSYYAPQGTDATIYPGVIDLKFINDSPGHILIWPRLLDNNTLVFDFYGTKDSRQVTLEKPVQYDRQTSGAMKATWTREVTLNGQTRTDVFKSNYASPALYHKTEEFGPTSTPPSDFHVGAVTQ